MKSVLLIGIGRFGKHIAAALNSLGHQVMAIDRSEEKISAIMPVVTAALIGDSTNLDFMSTIGVKNFDVCIVAIGSDFQSSLETTSLLEELGAKKIVARASRDTQAKFLLSNGATDVVYPEKQLAKWVAIRHTADHILDYIELDEDYAIFEVTIPAEWTGMSIVQLDIRRRYKINILALKRNGKMDMNITPDTVLTDDCTMMIIGRTDHIQMCFDI